MNQLDYEQAKRELSGESAVDRQDAVFRLAFDPAEIRSGELGALAYAKPKPAGRNTRSSALT